MNAAMQTRFPIATLLFLSLSSAVFAEKAAENKVGWVTAYWAGWVRISPNDVPWKTYTHLCIFSATPDARGGCKLAMGWNDRRVKAAVAEGHRNGVKVLLCVGGGGEGRNFVASTADAALRATLIKNIIALMKRYDFDGIDMDWEELQGKNAEYVALHKELRAAIDKIAPRPLLTAAIANWMFNRTTAQIHACTDQLNNMSYWTRAVRDGAEDSTDIAKDMQGLVVKGVPKAKLGVGIGLDYEERHAEVDCDPRACAAKCRFAIDKGYGGVMIWAIDKDAKKFGGKHPCHEAISAYKPDKGKDDNAKKEAAPRDGP
jgi:chitinase